MRDASSTACRASEAPLSGARCCFAGCAELDERSVILKYYRNGHCGLEGRSAFSVTKARPAAPNISWTVSNPLPGTKRPTSCFSGVPLTRDGSQLRARDLKRMRLNTQDIRLNEQIDEIEEIWLRVRSLMLEKRCGRKDAEAARAGGSFPPGCSDQRRWSYRNEARSFRSRR